MPGAAPMTGIRRARLVAGAALLWCLPALPASAADAPEKIAPATAKSAAALCALIGAAAETHGVPKPFFARLIWKESRFDIGAVSPVGAQGVAQFMPYTAKERGLDNPFDPLQAIPASAAFLAELKDTFGNFGLAAAAYNSGPDRVSRWLARGGRLPAETEDYVYSITARSADWFRAEGREVEAHPLDKALSFQEGCQKLPVMATRATPRPPWGAVVAGGRTYRAASVAFQRARAQARGRIDAGKLRIVKRGRRGAGPTYLAMLSASSRREARALCLKMRRAGVPCRVQRN